MFIGVLIGGVVLVALVLQALFAVRVEPIEVSRAPPEFIASITAERDVTMSDEESGALERVEPDEVADLIDEDDATLGVPIDIPSRGPNYSKIARDAVMNGESMEELLLLMKSEDADVRIAAAHELGQAFTETMGYHDESDRVNGYDLRVQFWGQVGDDIEDVRNALYEGLAYSVNNDEYNNIPYVIAWMPGQNEETLELLAWTSSHHQSAMMRKTTMYYVVNIDPKGELTTWVLEERSNDPSLRVRIDVLGHCLTRWVN